MVELLLPFLLFFPLLWALLLFVAFLPEVVVGVVGVLVSLPPPVCAKVRPAASNMVNATVNTFFIVFKSPLTFEREVQMLLNPTQPSENSSGHNPWFSREDLGPSSLSVHLAAAQHSCPRRFLVQ